MINRSLSFTGLFTLLVFCSVLGESACSVSKAESVTFFWTLGNLSADGKAWQVPIEGWVYEPEADSLRVSASRDLFRKALGIPEAEKDNPEFVTRANAFFVDNERGKSLTVQLGERSFTLAPSNAAGRVSERLRLPWQTRAGELHYHMKPCAKDSRVFEGVVSLLEPEGRIIVSDIDDTLKRSDVLNRDTLIANTFLKPFEAIPDMARLLTIWSNKPEVSVAFAYVSASPRPLYAALRDFLHAEHFPRGAIYLRPFRWKDESFVDLFKSSEPYKKEVIEGLLKQFPKRRFVLVGDTGENDPAIYAELARRYPRQVEHVYLRRVDPLHVREKYEGEFLGIPSDLWVVFADPKELF